jgi:thiol-disulfide isomerase/thioredoxin
MLIITPHTLCSLCLRGIFTKLFLFKITLRSLPTMNKLKFTCVILFLYLNVAAQLPDGSWHASLKLNDTLELPFSFVTSNNTLTIQNGEEDIIVYEISFEQDSVFIQMPVFDSEFRCLFNGRSMTGNFINHARKTKNVIPFQAQRGLSFRFSDKPEKTSFDISGKYHVIFNGEDDESKDAVGVFKQDGNRLTGTFLTSTGDYRYLEGEVSGNRMWLSAFDGSHLFLFTSLIKNDSLYNGEYFSGQHWHDTWRAIKDNDAKLIADDSLTLMKPGYDKFAFTFPDEDKKLISLTDPKFLNKAVIIQIMGTWCPNCMDETKFLSSWYNNERREGIEIIALDYEKNNDFLSASNNIRRLKKQYNIKYTILFAGSADKKEAALTLPMLNRVFAFPTTIFLNREKKVVKIHTGFTGPATGEEYEKFKEKFRNALNMLE